MSNQSEDKKPVAPAYGFEDITKRFYGFVDNLGTKKKPIAIVWLVIAIVLAVAASLPLPESLRWITPIVGIPAGIIVFGLGLGLVHTTNMRNWRLFSFKEDVPQRRRILPTVFALGAVVALVIISSSFLPSGVGGTIMVASALTAYNVFRRTPYEAELAAKGIPDPREYDEEEEEEFYEDEIEQENLETDDNLNEQTFFPRSNRGEEFKGRL